MILKLIYGGLGVHRYFSQEGLMEKDILDGPSTYNQIQYA